MNLLTITHCNKRQGNTTNLCHFDISDHSHPGLQFVRVQKLEPWLVSGVKVAGGLELLSAFAKDLPVSEDLDLAVDVEHLKAPPVSRKRLVMLVGVFSTGNNFERRMALRRTWMQYEAVRSGDVAVRFFIGLVSSILQAGASLFIFYQISIHPFALVLVMCTHKLRHSFS